MRFPMFCTLVKRETGVSGKKLIEYRNVTMTTAASQRVKVTAMMWWRLERKVMVASVTKVAVTVTVTGRPPYLTICLNLCK